MDSEESETMRYGVLGSDPSSLLEKLEKYTGEVDWAYLKPHYRNGALVWVDPALSITEVGHAFSIDDTDRVLAWRKSGDIVTPSEPHAAHWDENPARFIALVVSPFVLIQPRD
jgi:hypothetical protein